MTEDNLAEQRSQEAQIVELLIEMLQEAPTTISYTRLAKKMRTRFGNEEARAWHYFDKMLGRINDACLSLELPLISVMVVLQDGMKPGTGYVSYYKWAHPESSDMTDEQIAQEQWEQVKRCAEWQRLLDFYSIEMTFKGPGDYMATIKAREAYEEGRRIEKVLKSEIERNPDVRKACLREKGMTCVVCGFDSEDEYGVKGIIHVHHLRPLFELAAGELTVTDAINDVVPVCPNCHALIHSRGPREWYTIDEAREIVGKSEGQTTSVSVSHDS